jgi:hypothetical protein
MDVGLGTGEVISSVGQTSTQQDVVIYDRSILPPLVFESSAGLFPIEAALYVIQVKTNVTVSDVEAAHVAAAKLAGFQYAAGSQTQDGAVSDHLVTKAIPVLFAFDTDIARGDVLGCYQHFLDKELAAGRSSDPHLDSICVVGKGYWFLVNGNWVTWPRGDDFQEVVAFLSGILDNYKRVAATRLSPKLGNYIV